MDVECAVQKNVLNVHIDAKLIAILVLNVPKLFVKLKYVFFAIVVSVGFK
jgi:hypothetical protein